MKTKILILAMVAFTTVFSYATDPLEKDSASLRLKNSDELVERVMELVQEALYITDNDLPDLGRASVVVKFRVDYEGNFKLDGVEGSNSTINYIVENKLKKTQIKVDYSARCERFVMPITYEKHPWHEGL